MKNLFLGALFLLFPGALFAQDILVLKKDESELKVKIVTVNDTLISYRMWKSPDTSVYNLKRYEVLSFFYDDKSTQNETLNKPTVTVEPVIPAGEAGAGVTVKWNKTKWFKEKNSGLLERYHGGEQMSGYVVTIKNDSLSGTISVKNAVLNQLEVYFTGPDNKTVVYDVDSIKSYGYGGIRYEKVKTKFKYEIINNRPPKNGELFLDIEVDGPAKLYRVYTLTFEKSTYESNPNLPDYFGKMKHFYLITNPAGKQLSTKTRTIKGCVNNLFYDNKDLMAKIRDKGVDSSNLVETVRSYNEWYLNKK